MVNCFTNNTVLTIFFLYFRLQEEFEITKGVIRIHKSKIGQTPQWPKEKGQKDKLDTRRITIETKEVACIGYNGFPFPHSYSGEGIGATYIYLHLGTHAWHPTRAACFVSIEMYIVFCI